MSEMEPDWRALLVRYMDHVWEEEGIPYVPASYDDFSAEEIALLEQIADEIDKARKVPRR